jgi:hypothetical protein
MARTKRGSALQGRFGRRRGRLDAPQSPDDLPSVLPSANDSPFSINLSHHRSISCTRPLDAPLPATRRSPRPGLQSTGCPRLSPLLRSFLYPLEYQRVVMGRLGSGGEHWIPRACTGVQRPDPYPGP